MTERMQAKNAIKWIDALLSGKYKQGKNELGDLKFGFCCWGLGCFITKTPYKTNAPWNWKFSGKIGFKGRSGQLNKSFFGYNNLQPINDKTHAGFKRIGKFLIKTADLHFNSYVAKKIKKYYEKLDK